MTFVIGPAGDICVSRPQALFVQYSLSDGSSQANAHMTFEAISSREKPKSSGLFNKRYNHRLAS